MSSIGQNQFAKFPSKLQADFVSRVLSRLLPSREQIEKFSRLQLEELLCKKQELTDLITEDPVRFFSPSPGGQWDFMTETNPSLQGLYFFAGNKTGKTTGAAIIVSENATGLPLWGRETRTNKDLLLRGRQPIRIAAFCEDFSTHEETIVPTIFTWTPKKFFKSKPIERGPSGNITKVFYENNTIIYLRTYDQGYAKAEGKDYDLVWCDEPPPRDIYTAIFRGLVANRGKLIIAATLLSETWLYDDLALPFVKSFEATMYDNQWLDAQGRANLELLLTDDEKAIRIYGQSSNLTGKIFKSFKDSPPLVVPVVDKVWNPFKEEPYPVILGIDPHERKPVYCIWGWLTPENQIIWFAYKLVPSGNITDVFRVIADQEIENRYPTSLVIMDPNRGAAKQINNTSWEEEFQSHGYEVLLGNDDMKFGHAQLGEMINLTKPSMMWMETCRGKGGPIYQMERYTWDDHAKGHRMEKDLKEKPKQKFKDFPDIHRYVACAIRTGQVNFKLLTSSEADLVLNLNNAKNNSLQTYLPNSYGRTTN